MKALNIILILLTIVGVSYTYADCPSVTAIQNGRDKTVVDGGITWSSNISLQEVKTGAVFSQAMVEAVDIPPEDEDKKTNFYSLTRVFCKYTVKAINETKCEASENEACTLTLEPTFPLKAQQCLINKPERYTKPSWKKLEHDRGSYAKLLRYNCQPNPRTNLVSECPFSIMF